MAVMLNVRCWMLNGERVGRRGLHLFYQERDEVAGVEAVADLVSLAVEADVFEGLFLRPAVDPVAEDALVGFAELSGAGQDAATVDPHGKSEGGTIFES